MWTFPSLKTRFLRISKSKYFQDCTTHFSSFLCQKTRFLSISISTSLLDSTALISTFRTLTTFRELQENESLAGWFTDIWKIRDLKMQCWKTTNRYLSSSTQSISERFAAWKQNSWISAERPPFRTALTTFHRFEAWKRNSWESANRTYNRAKQPICERFQASKHLSWVSANKSLSWLHCTFLIVSLPKNAFLEHQQINFIAGQHCTNFNVSHPETTIR